jgi:citrate/tricarballylate utilization protein
MLSDDPARRARQETTVCNSCRYCEAFCPVFPAIEARRGLSSADLLYVANLCHNCGECLYACQYAPPHEFGINLPRTLAELRTRSYEQYCWPRPLGLAFRHHNLGTGLTTLAVLVAALMAIVWVLRPDAIWPSNASADFYAVIPHGVMVTLFGGVTLFVLVAMGISAARFWRDTARRGGQPSRVSGGGSTGEARAHPVWRALSDASALRHLHGGGVDCPSALDARAPWRRWFHHCTLYGFALCFASTSVAAMYHSVFHWRAPYGYTSLPVLLGTAGGLGLVVGPIGLAVLRRRRDPLLGDPDRGGLDDSFLALLLLASVTGLALLALRHQPVMGVLLIVHLGCVLALLVTLPYGKFVHGFYRLIALVQYHAERSG